MEKSSLGASQMQLDEEFVTIPRELYNHLREAHKLLGKGLRTVCSRQWQIYRISKSRRSLSWWLRGPALGFFELAWMMQKSAYSASTVKRCLQLHRPLPSL
jgi:hypothetical protein